MVLSIGSSIERNGTYISDSSLWAAPFEDDNLAEGLDLDGSGKLYRENLLSVIKRCLELDALGGQAD